MCCSISVHYWRMKLQVNHPEKWNCSITKWNNGKDFNLDRFNFHFELGCGAYGKLTDVFIKLFLMLGCNFPVVCHWLVWPILRLPSYQDFNALGVHHSACRLGVWMLTTLPMTFALDLTTYAPQVAGQPHACLGWHGDEMTRNITGI